MATDKIPGRVEFSILAFACLLLLCFKYFNNPLESTLVFSLLCYSWMSLCVFNSLKALALEHVPCLWTNVCISLDFQIYIYIYIYDVFSSIYIIVWESFIFVHSSRMIYKRRASMDK